MFEAIKKYIEENDVIVIHRHSHPDGDALGSQIGLKHIIEDSFVNKTVYVTGDEAGRYSFMSGSTMDNVDDGVFPNALCIILDSAEESLVSDSRYKNAAHVVRIDHHIKCAEFGNEEVVDTSFESCCGLITGFAMEQNLVVSKAAATALFTGMVTDSGRFRYDSTSSGTMRRAAFLLDCGADCSEIYMALYSEKFENIRFRARYIDRIQFSEKHVAYVYIDRQTMSGFEKDGWSVFSVARGMVNTMSDISGVDIWVNFVETEDVVWTEIRSSKYNVQPIAVKYGGGGHAKACGCDVKDYAEAMALIKDLENVMENEQ